jgi:hypothetical protein
MTRFVDFDAARAERVVEPLILKAYGREFQLPPAMSAALFLDIISMREGREDSDAVTFADAQMLLRNIMSEEMLADLLTEPNFSADDLISLAMMIMQAYTSGPSEVSPGGASAPSPKTARAGNARPAQSRGNPGIAKR